jgi:DNA-binding NarL/FixJ family response regulator
VGAEVVVVGPGELGELLATLFSQYGIAASCARTGEQALDVVLAEEPGVVIIEADLADADGMDLAALLKDELSVKVILTYAQHHLSDDRRDEFTARLRGVDAAFSRPFRSRTLIESAARLLGYEVDPELSGEFMIVRETPREDALIEGEEVPDVPPDQTSEVEREPVSVPITEVVRPVVRTDPAALSSLLAEKRAGPTTEAQPGPVGERSGRLTPRVLCDLLDAFHQSQTTGELWLSKGDAKRVILLVRGVVVGGRTNIRSEQLLAFAHRKKALSPAQVAQVQAAIAKDPARSVREVALADGLLSEETLKRLLLDQTRRIVLSSFAWRDGTWRETLLGHGKHEPHRVEMPIGDAILRGVQLTEHLDALREAAPDDARFAPNPDAPYSLHQLRLTADEAQLVVATDGTKTIEDLRTLFPKIEERAVRGLAAGLQRLELLRFVGHGPAEPRRISFF